MGISMGSNFITNFLAYCDSIGEYILDRDFLTEEQIKGIINKQGYWSGVKYRVLYNEETKTFDREERGFNGR